MMKSYYFIIVLTILNCSCTCTDKGNNRIMKETKSKGEIIGRIDKAYINLHLPINKGERSRLFYECNIENQSSKEVTFNFRYIPFDEGEHTLYVETNEHDTIALFVKLMDDKVFKVLPRQTRNVDFCVEFTSNLLGNKNLNNYLFLVDSLAFATNKILYMSSNDSTFEFTKSEDFLIEHRPLEYYSNDAGGKE